jgi:5-aminovalerate/4-aminobutyrate aminotransferase
MEQSGVAPDLTTFAKSIAGGFPLAGVCGKAELMDAIGPGGLGGTYAGSPVACAAALAGLEVFEEENLLARSRTLGDMIGSRLRAVAQDDKRIAEVRGLGAMMACELFDDKCRPDANLAAQLVARAREKGLILLSCGQYGNVIRILVPLTATDLEVQQGMDIIDACFREL